MTPDPSSKPELIVVALSIDPLRGSEPGKGWWWSCALSRHYRLHIVTLKHSLETCANESLPRTDGWSFHPTQRQVTTWKFPTGYLEYWAVLREMQAICRDLIQRFPIHGVCHVTLGSFRLLPRYDRLGVPYAVGPLGGGECSPLAITLRRPVPLRDKVTEILRPVINNSFALVPPLRRCLGAASLVLTTSVETEAVVRRMGARRTATVFPDAYINPIDVEKIGAQRALQLDSVRKSIRLIWQGRSLWWKGPDLALDVLRAALACGLRVEVSLVSHWNAAYEGKVRAIAEKMGISAHVHFLGGTSREKFLETMGEHHGMLATSLHDSGGIPLIEAQALGLPCFTLGLGGHQLAACPDAGVAESPHRIGDFVERSVACLARWQQDPAAWLAESHRAIRFSTQFTIDRLADDVGRLIVPALAQAKSGA
jgi:glycosyltransferase involved in cell wall biosynthesis